MRVQRLRLCAVLFVGAVISACSGGLSRQPILPATPTTAAGVNTCASAAVQPAWVFKGACQSGNIGPKGTHISLGAYRGFTVTGSIGKTDLNAKSPFVVVEATGKHDVEKYHHKAFPRYSARGSTTLLYLEVVNGGTKPITIKGKPAITLGIADSGTIFSQCALALLTESKSSYSWTALAIPVTPVKTGYRIKIPSLPISLDPGAAYLALSCANVAPSPSPSSSPSPSPTASSTVTAYQLPASAAGTVDGIAAGPDGNVWFTESDYQVIGKITPTGTATIYPVTSTDNYGYSERIKPTQIVSGSDGKLWFVGSDAYFDGGCGCLFSSTRTGTMSFYRVQPPGCNDVVATAIAAGPDDDIWLSVSGVTGSGDCSLIAKFSPVNHTFTFYDAGNSEGLVSDIAAGSDGNVWFTDTKGYIGRITTTGTLTTFAFSDYGAGSLPSGIVGGQDHALWFTYGPYSDSAPTGIARITTAGSITEFPHAVGDCEGPSTTDPIVSAPDGYLWFGCYDRLAKSSTAGAVTDYPASLLDYTGVSVRNMTWGTDGNLWIGGGTGTIGKFKP